MERPRLEEGRKGRFRWIGGEGEEVRGGMSKEVGSGGRIARIICSGGRGQKKFFFERKKRSWSRARCLKREIIYPLVYPNRPPLHPLQLLSRLPPPRVPQTA
jgi:hypothetical protein